MRRPARPRFGFERIVELIDRYRASAAGAHAMDRRVVLAHLAAELQADEALLRLRGFDRAYRRIVEGV